MNWGGGIVYLEQYILLHNSFFSGNIYFRLQLWPVLRIRNFSVNRIRIRKKRIRILKEQNIDKIIRKSIKIFWEKTFC